MQIYLLTPASMNVLQSRTYAVLEPALMPMALGYLGAVLRQGGHQVLLRDQAATVMSGDAVLDEMVGFEPDVIGISVLTGAWHSVVKLVEKIRVRLPGARIVMGNTHASCFAEEILGEGHADYVVHGEGEETLPDLVDALGDGRDPGSVPGISWMDGTTCRRNPDRPPIEDLDALPYPAWDLLDLSAWRYQKIPLVNLKAHPLPVMASRGCSYSCSFCSQDKAVRKFRHRRIEKVVDEIGTMVDRHGFRCFGFNDSYFPWDRESGLEFCDRLKARPWNEDMRWVTETRVDRVDDELMAAMKSAGLHSVFFGFESGNQAVLKSLGKGTTVEQGREAVRMAHRHGVKVIGFFMIGIPGESREAIEETVRFAIDTGVDIAKFAVTVPYPGSHLFDRIDSRQLSLEDCDQFTSWFDWTGRCEVPVWAPDGMSGEDLVHLQRSAMVRFYARPSYVWKALRENLFSVSEMAFGGWILLSRLIRS